MLKLHLTTFEYVKAVNSHLTSTKSESMWSAQGMEQGTGSSPSVTLFIPRNPDAGVNMPQDRLQGNKVTWSQKHKTSSLCLYTQASRRTMVESRCVYKFKTFETTRNKKLPVYKVREDEMDFIKLLKSVSFTTQLTRR
jgi:hypothetical protein